MKNVIPLISELNKLGLFWPFCGVNCTHVFYGSMVDFKKMCALDLTIAKYMGSSLSGQIKGGIHRSQSAWPP